LAISLLAVLLGFSLCLPAVRAQQSPAEKAPPAAAEKPHAGKPEQAEPKPLASAALPADAVTAHTIAVNGRELAYTATAGTLALANDKGERSA
jgi:carboxypeptidase C (cathepsin A)